MQGIIATIRRIDEKFVFEEQVDMLIKLGVRIFRFNASKFEKDKMEQLMQDIEYIRNTYESLGVEILLDIPYPCRKVRLKIKNMISAKKDMCFTVKYMERESEEVKIIGIDTNGIGLEEGDEIIYANGEGAFRVEKTGYEGGYLVRALNDFGIRDKKSINVRAKNDVFDYDIITRINPDYVALSFTEKSDELKILKDKINNRPIKLIAKIETYEGVENVSDILEQCDGVMLARGDLGLNVKLNEFVEMEKKVCLCARNQNKILMAATGIGESLLEKYVPSRADLSDIAFLKGEKVDYIVISVAQSVSQKVDRLLRILEELG